MDKTESILLFCKLPITPENYEKYALLMRSDRQ